MDSPLTALPRSESSGHGRLRPVVPGLWATPTETLSGPVTTCGFLIERDEGNAFVCSCTSIGAHFGRIDELGGVALVLLNHRDEAGSYVTALAERYGATVHAHHAEVGPCRERGVIAISPLGGDTELGADLEAWLKLSPVNRHTLFDDLIAQLDVTHARRIIEVGQATGMEQMLDLDRA